MIQFVIHDNEKFKTSILQIKHNIWRRIFAVYAIQHTYLSRVTLLQILQKYERSLNVHISILLYNEVKTSVLRCCYKLLTV